MYIYTIYVNVYSIFYKLKRTIIYRLLRERKTEKKSNFQTKSFESEEGGRKLYKKYERIKDRRNSRLQKNLDCKKKNYKRIRRIRHRYNNSSSIEKI